MSLSICLITRNAEQAIPRALTSVATLAAEVIVIDTGSSDATVAVATALGAKVSVIPWQDDFGAAQNQAMAQATGDWVLWLNPDEELMPQGQEQIPDLLARFDAFAYVLRVHEMMRADRPDRVTETLDLRLFRRHPALQFIGRLHPQFVTPVEELARREKQQIIQANLWVCRHAYLSTLTPDKLHWATRLLELELKDRPGQLHYLIEYGRNLLRLNDPRGHTILAEVSAQVQANSDAPTAPVPTVASLFEYLLTVSPEQSQSTLSPTQVRQLVERWFPKSPPLLWCLANGAFQSDDFRGAAELLERLVEMGRTGAYDHSAAFDPSIVRESALLNLGRCYVRLGDLDRAELCFGQLLASADHHIPAREGLALVQNLKRNRPSK